MSNYLILDYQLDFTNNTIRRITSDCWKVLKEGELRLVVESMGETVSWLIRSI